jgi:hypothetical protein
VGLTTGILYWTNLQQHQYCMPRQQVSEQYNYPQK